MATRILIADDHDIFRECTVGRLSQEEGFQVVGHVAHAAEVVLQGKAISPDIVLMDINMPGSPFLAGSGLRRQCPHCHVVFLTGHPSDQNVADCLWSGARGIVTKRHSMSILVEAVRAVVRGEYYFVPEVLARLTFEDGVPSLRPEIAAKTSSLTPREREVLRMLAEGHSVKQTAKALYVSVRTIGNQTTSIMAKLQIHNRAGLVRYAIREQMISA
jgi:DNA-binding NarL/FixJ family response regulator